jgi:hypothetical protein
MYFTIAFFAHIGNNCSNKHSYINLTLRVVTSVFEMKGVYICTLMVDTTETISTLASVLAMDARVATLISETEGIHFVDFIKAA